MEIEIPIEVLPVPKSLFDFSWAIIGWQLGKAFGGFDEEFLESVPSLYKRAVYRVLHFIHHYWIGLLLIIYCGSLIYDWKAVFGAQGALRAAYWLGYGLFVEDGWHHVVAYVRVRLGGERSA